MKTTLKSLALASIAVLAAQAHAQAEPAPAPAAAPEYTLTSNIGLVSDYRFRGISQTWRLPAIQGGFDYVRSSGLYLGTWASNVSGNSYNNGAGLELDLYGGYKFALSQDLTLDLGALAYVYPGAKLNSAPGVATGEKYTNVDVYLGLSAGAFSAKLSVAATDYFGLDSTTAGYAYFSALNPKGSSKGSAYLDLNYRFELGGGINLDTHFGHLVVRHYGDLSYSDVKLGLSKEVGGFTLGAAVVATDADKAYYQAGNSAGLDAKRLGRTTLLLSASRSF
ncbi:MAG: TorF family putative porin [Burkholderiaceae bacterium]